MKLLSVIAMHKCVILGKLAPRYAKLQETLTVIYTNGVSQILLVMTQTKIK